jgi:hypothetical protein
MDWETDYLLGDYLWRLSLRKAPITWTGPNKP